MIEIYPLPATALLHECFSVSDESPSGIVWRQRPPTHFPTSKGWKSFNKQLIGKTAGAIMSCRGKLYYRVRLFGSQYMVHRILYSMYHNVELSTELEVDHIDGDGTNNSKSNLRLATRTNNTHNQVRVINNTSGIKGVYYHKINGTYFGAVRVNGVTHYTGYSPSKEIIEELVRELRETLHKEFTNHG